MTTSIEPGPLFILCASRSGSTLLRYVIDSHPEIGCPPEFHLSEVAKKIGHAYQGFLPPRLFDSKQQLNAAIVSHMRSHVEQMMRHYTETVGKAWWCEKSILSVEEAHLLKAMFPRARFLCLYRNCLDMTASGLEALRHQPTGRGFGFSPFLQNAWPSLEAGVVDYWIDRTTLLLGIEEKYPESCFRITYESLVERRESTCGALFEFIGVDWKPEWLDTVFEVDHHLGPGDFKIRNTDTIHTRSVGRGHTVDRAKIGRERIRKINQLHQRLGYQPVQFSTRWHQRWRWRASALSKAMIAEALGALRRMKQVVPRILSDA
jgi:protein-tyrosine sulfotransferase